MSVLTALCWPRSVRFVREGSEFTKDLAMGSIQMGGLVHSSPLPEISANLAPPRPASWTRPDGKVGQVSRRRTENWDR